MYNKDVKWMKSKTTGKNVPCEPKLVHFIINPHSPVVYYTIDGEPFRGIEHPAGCMLGYRIKPRDFFDNYKKKTEYRY